MKKSNLGKSTDVSLFNLQSPYSPAGDQPQAIAQLNEGLKKGFAKQTLLGATGTGKTYTIAQVIANYNKPTLVIAHNKTLAAQLAQEYKEFFPNHAVHYFVSYYDYYQPEAYMPVTDTFIEKDAQINEEIDRLRHASTQALLSRRDVIIVSSVSCIYGLGSPEEYAKEHLVLTIGDEAPRLALLKRLIKIHFERTNADLKPGTFRSMGNKVEIMPVSERFQYHIELEGNKIARIFKIDPISATILANEQSIFLFPAKHFLTEDTKKTKALVAIKKELAVQLKKFEAEGKLLEAERLKRRTNYDLAMIREMGYCSGIENYSRHLSGKLEGEPPETLLSYFPTITVGTGANAKKIPDFLTVIDESHVTVPQLTGMFAGDAARKKTLVEYGFRLPSAKDNRPLQFAEFDKRVGQVIYTSATPSHYELENSAQVVQQIIRPTGLVDPLLFIRPVLAELAPKVDTKKTTKKTTKNIPDVYPGQVADFIKETMAEIKKGGRVLATTLTKKMAEDLSIYLKEKEIKSEYLHSDIKTIDRIRIITSFRKGEFDCLVGVNLLREGLDMPEVTLIGILDADKEGFLRSETSLIQTIGRAARNVNGRVILYADRITGSMERAIGETDRRREIQLAYNKKHGITPMTIIKSIKDIAGDLESGHQKAVRLELSADETIFAKSPEKLIKLKEKDMSKAVKDLDFETAAILRDEIKVLRARLNS